MLGIDVKDRKILYQLDLNSRQSLNAIGSSVRLSKSLVQYRIDRLVKTGIIKNFYTSIDFYKLGYINLGIYVNYQYYTPEIEKNIIQYFVDSQHAWFIANIQGKFDLIVLFSVSNMNQFFSFWKNTLKKYRFYFQNALISFFTKTHYLPISYILKEDNTVQRLDHEIIDGGEQIEIEDIDRAILERISLNSRKPLIEIAEELHTSSTTIANRIKKLENMKVINGYRINIDYLKLGYQLFNIHLNYHIENFNELHKIIKEIYNEFPNDVKNHMTFSYPEIYKHNYHPRIDI
jgi:DNA-binding Lrp family transcriptional regulator